MLTHRTFAQVKMIMRFRVSVSLTYSYQRTSPSHLAVITLSLTLTLTPQSSTSLPTGPLRSVSAVKDPLISRVCVLSKALL